MRQTRGTSQVLFSFLPDQTADLENSVWRVTGWSEARPLNIDADVVRKELLRAIYPWRESGKDAGLADLLYAHTDMQVVAPSVDGGVRVEPFPNVYRCKACHRVRTSNEHTCKCGKKVWAQMAFVAYHTCGRLEEPWIKTCPEHKDVRVTLPGTATTRDMVFDCPVCGREISKGFQFVKCSCGDGTLSYNIHRAAIVFTPRTTVIVNPPDQEVAAQLRSKAAAAQTLAWVLDGAVESNPLKGKPTLDALVATFVQQGLDEGVARKMAEAAAKEAGGAVTTTDPLGGISLQQDALEEAEDSALKIAFAVAGGRMRLPDLVGRAGPTAKRRYEKLYPPAIASGCLSDVELLENFPVVTTAFGYTRGETSPGSSTLRWFKGEGGSVRAYGVRADTEALLFRLDPLAVGRWMADRGRLPVTPTDARSARVAILENCVIPRPGEVVDPETAGSALLTLVHSYSHRVIRKISAFAGIDRDSLSEYLVPLHLAFVVYASTRGTFVLGGLQALFEHDLDDALREIVRGESRCPLDPVCADHGRACVACLHVGEPSCRFYNQFLDRDVLFGQSGLFVAQ
jgi:hypothetical protein